MVKITQPRCREQYVSALHVARVVPTSSGHDWSLRAVVYLHDGTCLESSDEASDLARRVDAEIDKLVLVANARGGG